MSILRKLLKLLTVAVMLVTSTSSADAAVVVSIVWTSTTGAGTPGSSVIEAVPGDQIVGEIRITPDAGGVSAYSLSLHFDTDLKDELDLVDVTEFVPGVMETAFTPNAPGGSQESTGAQIGAIHTIESVTLTIAGPTSGTFVAGSLTFDVTGNVETDGDDVFTGLLNVDTDGFGNNSFSLITPAFSHAAVDLGAPPVPMLSAFAVVVMSFLVAMAAALVLSRRIGRAAR